MTSAFDINRYPVQVWKMNMRGLGSALGIAREHGARFLYASSTDVYGNPDVIPTPETYIGRIDPTEPGSYYAEIKRSGESYCIANRMQRKLDVRIARIFDTYGPRMRADSIYGGVVARFIKQALKEMPITVFGDGMQTRSFCFVSDMVEGLLRFISSDECEGEVVNMGSEEETRIIDLAKEIKRLTNSSSEIVLEELPEDELNLGRMCPDITKAKRILGWEPKVRLEEGLKKTIEWFEENGR
jgi:UDP-glucuronate decarboxylase